MPSHPSSSTPELTAILLQDHESKDFDYKSAMKWDESDKGSCCGLVKDILAMANTHGDFIAIGVSETPTGFSFDGLPEACGGAAGSSQIIIAGKLSDELSRISKSACGTSTGEGAMRFRSAQRVYSCHFSGHSRGRAGGC